MSVPARLQAALSDRYRLERELGQDRVSAVEKKLRVALTQGGQP